MKSSKAQLSAIYIFYIMYTDLLSACDSTGQGI